MKHTIEVTCYKLGGLCLKAAEQLRTEGKATEADEAAAIGTDLLEHGMRGIVDDKVIGHVSFMQVYVP